MRKDSPRWFWEPHALPAYPHTPPVPHPHPQGQGVSASLAPVSPSDAGQFALCPERQDFPPACLDLMGKASKTGGWGWERWLAPWPKPKPQGARKARSWCQIARDLRLHSPSSTGGRQGRRTPAAGRAGFPPLLSPTGHSSLLSPAEGPAWKVAVLGRSRTAS